MALKLALFFIRIELEFRIALSQPLKQPENCPNRRLRRHTSRHTCVSKGLITERRNNICMTLKYIESKVLKLSNF